MARAQPDSRVQLVFSGQCVDGRDPLEVRRAVGKALKLSQRHTERLFSGKHIVLKRQVDEAAAMHQIARFATLGAVLRTEPPLRVVARSRPPRLSLRSSVVALWRWPPRPSSAVAAGMVGLLVLVTGISSWRHLSSSATAESPQTPPLARATALAASAAPLAAPLPAAAIAATKPATAGVDDQLPRQLSAQAQQDYLQRYLREPWHKAFVVNAAGAHVWVVGAATPALAQQAALAQCTQGQSLAVSGCRVADVDGEPQDPPGS